MPATPTAANPLREGAGGRRQAEPCTIVVFGATGDLTARKLIPALFNLYRNGHLPSRFAIVGFARREKPDDDFRKDLETALYEFARIAQENREQVEAFLKHVYYQRGQLDSPSDFSDLAKRLKHIEAERNLPANHLLYLAVSPDFFEPIVRYLDSAGLSKSTSSGWTRVIIEKPFGTDLDSARALNKVVQSVFEESQVYRIDHYLGKETVQNILAFRFANSIFEPLWSSRYIDHVQITMAEEVGMPGRRGQYFDTAGMLRDVVQNHVFQLLCLTAMEPPASLDADSLRDEKVRVLRAIRTPSIEEVTRDVVRGQYGPGSLRGKAAAGYRQENEIAPGSVTETYVAMKLEVRNWRWAGVPFYLRAGKRMPKRATEIAIVFKQPPHEVFDVRHDVRRPNVLALRIQPDEGISMTFAAKQPGLASSLQPVQMDFRYGSSFGQESPEAYERLLLDGVVGDGSLFTRADEVEEAWRLCTAMQSAWDATPKPENFPNYEAGSWGPKEADRLLEGRLSGWRRL